MDLDNNSPKENEQTEVQTYSIKDSIFDPKYNKKVSGATIIIRGQKFYSALSYNFTITELIKGKHKVVVYFVYYLSKSMEIDVASN